MASVHFVLGFKILYRMGTTRNIDHKNIPSRILCSFHFFLSTFSNKNIVSAHTKILRTLLFGWKSGRVMVLHESVQTIITRGV